MFNERVKAQFVVVGGAYHSSLLIRVSRSEEIEHAEENLIPSACD
jgi:hypothetical protein